MLVLELCNLWHTGGVDNHRVDGSGDCDRLRALLILGSFWGLILGPILGSFWVSFWVPLGAHFGSAWELILGPILGPPGDRIGADLEGR